MIGSDVSVVVNVDCDFISMRFAHSNDPPVYFADETKLLRWQLFQMDSNRSLNAMGLQSRNHTKQLRLLSIQQQKEQNHLEHLFYNILNSINFFLFFSPLRFRYDLLKISWSIYNNNDNIYIIHNTLHA